MSMLRVFSIVLLLILAAVPLLLPFASGGSPRDSFRKPALQVVIDAVPKRYRLPVAVGYLALLFLALVILKGRF